MKQLRVFEDNGVLRIRIEGIFAETEDDIGKVNDELAIEFADARLAVLDKLAEKFREAKQEEQEFLDKLDEMEDDE